MKAMQTGPEGKGETAPIASAPLAQTKVFDSATIGLASAAQQARTATTGVSIEWFLKGPPGESPK